MRRRRSPRQLASVLVVSVLALGSCYRAEIDLTPLADMLAGTSSTAGSGDESGSSGDVPAGGGSGDAPSGGESGSGGSASSGGESGSGGRASMPSSDRIVVLGGILGRGGSGGSDLGGGPNDGQCYDAPLSSDHETCRLTGDKPVPQLCGQDPQGWRGCYNGGCAVCTLNGAVPGYPYYFAWHPCCSTNDACSNHDLFHCDPLCPEPTEHDKVAPCGVADPNPG